MRIETITLYRVCIPLKKPFKHALHTRMSTDNIIVVTELADGTVGYGEGLPRPYVTGETQESVMGSLTSLKKELFASDFGTLNEVLIWIDKEFLSQKNFLKDREQNTARCALELSLLDAFTRYFRATFADVRAWTLPNEPKEVPIKPVRYDGIVSLDSLKKTWLSTFAMKIYGFKRLKVKLGPDIDKSVAMLKWLRRIAGRRTDLRIDGNEAWSLKSAKQLIEKIQRFNISSVEQPLPHSELADMQQLRKSSPIPLMLDESLCSLDDAQKAIDGGFCDLFNIRLSKCGGFINSLRIAKLARANQIGYQLGCMVGETGILSAAGRHFAQLDPQLRYLEGSYDKHLLGDSIVKENLSFGWGGKAPALTGFGLCTTVDPQKLRKYAIISVPMLSQ